MAEQKHKETIFGFPVETFVRQDKEAEDEVGRKWELFD